MSTPLDVSVVVAARDAAPYLAGLLGALDAQSLPAERFEVIVVDDGSSDASPELLDRWAAESPEVRIVLRGERAGRAAARNAGVAAARAPLVAFTDADVLPERDWLETLLAASADERVAAVEGAVVPCNGAAPHTHQAVNTVGGLYMTASIAYRRRVLEEVGGFDESFPVLEDVELAFRVLDAGHTIAFVPDALVRHRAVAQSARARLAEAQRHRWLGLLAQKHPERYRAHRARYLRPVTRVDVHIMAGAAGLALGLAGHGKSRVAGLVLGANGLRVLARTGRLDLPPGDLPGHALSAIALPFFKAFWWGEGAVRFRRRRP